MTTTIETTTPRAGSPAWWRARATRPRRRSGLTPERIVDAAIRLLDAEGLEAFSMRTLARELHTAPASLYRHYETREAVLVAVLDQIIGLALDIEPPGDTPGERAANVSRLLRQLLLRRPYLAVLWQTTDTLGPHGMRVRERVLQLVVEAGVPRELVARAYLAVLHFTIAFAAIEINLSFRTPEVRRETEEHFGRLSPDEFPVTRQLAHDLTQTSFDDEYELGLRTLMAGFLPADGAG